MTTTSQRLRGASAGAAAVTAILVTSCSHVSPPAKAPEACPKQDVTVSLLASPRANLTPSGAPRAVVVRVYQLKSDVRLANSRFEQIWKDDKAALGDELVKVDEQEIYPGTRADVKFARPDEVQYVAAVALFQNPQGRSWMLSTELPSTPVAGACDPNSCDAEDTACRARAVSAPKLSFFIDGNKVADGLERMDQDPAGGGPQ